MNKRETRKLQNVGREILKLEAVAIKLKEMGTEADLPVVIYNINRILGSINVLKANVSDPLRIVYSRTAASPPEMQRSKYDSYETDDLQNIELRSVR